MSVDPFSPLYLGAGLDVNAYVIDERYVYYVEDIFEQSGAIAVTQVYDMGTDSDLRTIHATFGQQGLVGIANPLGNPNGTYLIYTTDGHLGAGATWSTYQVSPHYTTQAGADDRTGVFARGSNLIYIAVRITTGVTGASEIYEVDVAGGPSSVDWGVINGQRQAGLFHFPHDNGQNDPHDNGHAGSSFVYGERGAFNTGVHKRVNSVLSDIIPFEGGNQYGVGYVISAEWLLHTYPLDINYLICCGSRDGGSTNLVFYSSNFGDAWTTLTGSSGYRYAGISGDDENVAYLCGTSGKIGFVADLFSGSPPTILDKRGNIPTDYPGVGNFYFVIGG
jgi:hypothetical protein